MPEIEILGGGFEEPLGSDDSGRLHTNERMKRLTLVYLVSYLAVGGAGFLFAPDFALSLLLSDGEYGDVMPRVLGMFMLALALLIGGFVRRSDYSYYGTTILARSFIVAVLTFLYGRTADPLFLTLNVIVLLGLLPAMYLQFVARGAPSAGV